MMSWIEDTGCMTGQTRKKSKVSLHIQKWLKSPKRMNLIEHLWGEKALRVYVFFAYDFFDTGIMYFLKRFKKKCLKKIKKIQ